MKAAGGFVALVVFVMAVLIITLTFTDATRSNVARLGDRHEISCYSGGVLILHDFSTGKPALSGSALSWSDGTLGHGAHADCVWTNIKDSE